MKVRGTYLTSIISVPSRLISDFSSVKQKIGCYPSIRLVSEGTTIKYLIDCEYPERFYVLELRSDAITLTLSSTSSPKYFMGEALLRLANILTILSEDYESDLRCLLPYMGLVLRDRGGIPDRCAEKPFNREADVILSRRIVELSLQNKTAHGELARTKSKLTSSIATYLLHRHNGAMAIDLLAKELGVERDDVSASLARLRELGYRTVQNKTGGFDLVRV